jgi:predicted ester cyclase
MPDPSPTPEALVRRWFEELWNQGREGTIDELLAADAMVHGLPGGESARGPEGFKPIFRQFKGAFPDMRIDIGKVVREGDSVACHCTVTGTHTGPGFGAASNNRISFTGITIVRARDGKLVEGWNAFDFLGCFQQIRLLPALG